MIRIQVFVVLFLFLLPSVGTGILTVDFKDKMSLRSLITVEIMVYLNLFFLIVDKDPDPYK
jgi:hypothetical protein